MEAVKRKSTLSANEIEELKPIIKHSDDEIVPAITLKENSTVQR